MSDFFKINPIAIRHCILYEFLRENPIERSFIALRKTVGPGVIEREEFHLYFNQFKQGIFDINDDKEPIADMRDVLRSDKYALRACILYESIKYIQFQRGFSSFQLWPNSKVPDYNMQCNQPFFFHKNFCKVVGEDVMEYKEFEFWFYHFLKGEFDLNYERDKNKKILELMDMPIDIVKEVVKYLNIFDRMKLAKTSRSLQTFVEEQKLFHRTLGLEVNYSRAEISFDDWSSIEYTDNNIGCVKTNSPGYVKTFKKHREKRVKSVCFWKEALRDFKSMLKHSKLHLNTLEIKLHSRNDIVIDDLEAALKFNHYLNVKELRIAAESSEALLKILPSLKPGYLTYITNDVNHMKVEMSEKIREMKQWKQAKRFSMSRAKNSYKYNCPLDHLYHFNEFTIFKDKITLEEILQMKKILFKSPNFQKCLFIFPPFLDLSIVEQGFGNALDEDPLIYHYPIPNSTEYFEIKVGGWTLEIHRQKC